MAWVVLQRVARFRSARQRLWQRFGRCAVTHLPDAALQLDRFFDDQQGWFCAGYVAGDPSLPKGAPGYTPLKEEWFHFPRQRQAALEWQANHDAQSHNTYFRQCLFSTKSGKQENALPSRVVWQDDVTDPHKPCSTLIQPASASIKRFLSSTARPR
jgi:hypothetical protein